MPDIVIKPTLNPPIVEFTGSNSNTSFIRQSLSGLVISSSLSTFTGSIYLSEDLAINGGDITTSATTFNIGNTSTGAQTLNLGNAITTSGQTKTVNLGIGGALGSTTNVYIGSGGGGATNISSPSFAVGGNSTLGNNIAHSTVISGDLAVNGGDITTSATTFNIGNTPTTTQTLNIGSAVIASGQTKTINIGNAGAAGSTTNINIGSTSNSSVNMAGNLDVAGSVFVNEVKEKTFGAGLTIDGVLLKDSGVKCSDIEIKNNQIFTGTLSRRIQHIPENFGDQSITMGRSITLSNSALSANFPCDSEFLISKLKIGDTISFFSHIGNGTTTGTPGSAAQVTSSIILGTSSTDYINVISKIIFAHNAWYEAAHSVTAHILNLTPVAITIATTGMGCNLYNNDESTVSPTIIPRIITLTYSSGANLFFLQRCSISGATTTWTVNLTRKVDKAILHKFSNTL